MKFPERLAAEHRVKGDDLVDVDWRESEPLCHPLDCFLWNAAVRLLDRVQYHQRRRALFVVGIMCEQLRDFGVELRRGFPLRIAPQRIWNWFVRFGHLIEPQRRGDTER